ncbi:hypothetical protein [Marinimicrobium alkaliphilum]|uniref:hypothetical protein n=1 Tax=Marinimicrobium alkaliphilum TaxID=2202654 RepID=UPI0018E09A82|nr:hypothetical protein [Marinimicrobium alkaliphilum]
MKLAGIVLESGHLVINQFSHDGRSPNKELSSNQTILIHPCYWLALNVARDYLSQEDSEEIYDEYEKYGIDVHSSEKEERSKRIGRIVSELETIPEGPSGASKFEAWCHEAIQIVFAARLTNVELENDSQSPKIRDIEATNQGGSRF